MSATRIGHVQQLTHLHLRPHPEEHREEMRLEGRGRPVNGGAYLYMLRCSDGSYYVGTARIDLELRVAQHNGGTFGGYTSTRRPVNLIFSQHFESITEAIEAERQVKGWTRAKKEALVRGDWDRLKLLARRGRNLSQPSS